MTKVQRSIYIDAPVEKVFGYLDDPSNIPKICPDILEVKDVERLPNGGYSYRWVYKMAGMHREGPAQTTRYVPNERIVEKSAANTTTWIFRPESEGTRVTLEYEYGMSIPLVGRLVESLTAKQAGRELETNLTNLKAGTEAEARVAS